MSVCHDTKIFQDTSSKTESKMALKWGSPGLPCDIEERRKDQHTVEHSTDGRQTEEEAALHMFNL